MKNLLKFAFAALFAAVLLSGCSQDNNPVAPSDGGNGNEGGGDPVVKTPIYMSIENISVRGFPEKKSNGDTWDFNLLSATERKPDIEVILRKDGSSSPVFWSDMRRNADYKSTYVFTNARSSSDGSLPYSVPQSQTYRVSLIDVDLISSDDMGYVLFKPSSIYKDDNATTFDYTATRNGVKIRIRGSWIY